MKKNKCLLVNNEKDFLKYTSRPTHITHKIFGKDYAAIHEIKPVLTLNKPIYVRSVIQPIHEDMLDSWILQMVDVSLPLQLY